MDYFILDTILNFRDEDLTSDDQVNGFILNNREFVLNRIVESEQYLEVDPDELNENDLRLIYKEIKEIVSDNDELATNIIDEDPLYYYQEIEERAMELKSDSDSVFSNTKFTDIQNKLLEIVL